MRKLLVATIMCAGVVMQAGAANSEQYSPEMKAYVNFGFGAPKAQSLGMHYGFRMDYDRRLQASLGLLLPSMMQLDFSADTGFDSAQLNGQSFLKRTVQLNQDGDGSATTGSSFTTLDWGLLAVGVVGVGFGISQVAKTKESSDPVTTTITTTDANGNPTTVLVTTVDGVITSVTSPTGAPVSVPSLPVGSAPTLPTSGQCLPGTTLCSPFGDNLSGFRIETRDINHDTWLDADYGHMGDLYAQ